MRRIADLTPEEAIDLWWDNGDELSALFNNEKIKEAKKGKNSDFVKAIIRECPNEIKKVLLWLDPDPITPFNLFPRVLDFILGMQSEGTADFFTSAAKTEASTVSADATENTEGKAN
jgi:hypothetical protein